MGTPVRFNASVDFCDTFHPQQGCIRCIKTLRDVEKGEELFIDYDYELGEHTPRWYRALLYDQATEEDSWQNVDIKQKWFNFKSINKLRHRLKKWLLTIELF